MTKPGIVFDLDGTIFKAEELAVVAYREMVAEMNRLGLYKRELPTRKECKDYLGRPMPEIWEKVFPGADSYTKGKAADILSKTDIRYLKEGRGTLYQGVEVTLEELKNNGHDLFIASNGEELYVKKVIEVFKLNSLFEKVYSAGEYSTENKVALLRIITSEFPSITAMVGDRSSDVEAGKGNGLITIGCLYGYGKPEELTGADYLIDSIEELLEILAIIEK